jgi:uncharacterized protein YcbX
MNISQINIYPIKSLKGISVQSAVIEDRGLQYDRRWMLINRENNFLSQRTYPRMATISVRIAKHGLLVNDRRLGDKMIPFEPRKPRIIYATIWRNRSRTLVYDDEVNEWFSDALGGDVRLVRMPDTTERRVNQHYKVRQNDVVSLADGYPYMLLGESSLADLNWRLAEPLPMDRFRPNFVVTGSGPFEEDTWRKIRIDNNVFYVVKPCARCKITMVDQQTGERGQEPLPTLARYRTQKIGTKQGAMFGQNLIAEKAAGFVNVGDRVEVLETKISSSAAAVR